MKESKKPVSSFLVNKENEGKRLDEFLAEVTSLSRAQIIRMIDGGAIQLQGAKTKKGVRLVTGQQIFFWEAPLDAQQTPPIAQPELPLHVLFENENVVAINKQAGLPSHPLLPLERDTLASALVARYPECANASEYPREGGLCHRLDRFTSGVLLAARKKEAWQEMRYAFHEGAIQKEYIALCEGHPQADQGEITEPLLPVPGKQDRMQIARSPEEKYSPEALSATTQFEIIKKNNSYSLLRILAITGRRHQIRVHLASIGLPLVGDVQYGGTKLSTQITQNFSEQERGEVEGQFLHASKLSLPAFAALKQESLIIYAPLRGARRSLLQLLLGDISLEGEK